MKKIFALTAAIAMSVAAGVSAETTQTAVLGDTGNAQYPLRVQGADGRIYICEAGTFVDTDGVTKRRCQGDDASPLFAAGAGLAGGGAVAAGALLLVVLAANDGSTGTTTTTTTTNP
tara:strand:+ start:1831 stop:2181 length:351 start_codon:yes stop_codon:yes gene_type:complete